MTMGKDGCRWCGDSVPCGKALCMAHNSEEYLCAQLKESRADLAALRAAAAELIAALPAGALRNDQADARMAVIRLTELLAKERHEPT